MARRIGFNKFSYKIHTFALEKVYFTRSKMYTLRLVYSLIVKQVVIVSVGNANVIIMHSLKSPFF